MQTHIGQSMFCTASVINIHYMLSLRRLEVAKSHESIVLAKAACCWRELITEAESGEACLHASAFVRARGDTELQICISLKPFY